MTPSSQARHSAATHAHEDLPDHLPDDATRRRLHTIPRVHRTTIAVLVVAQALGGIGTSMGVAVASLLATQVSGDESLSGLSQTAQIVGSAVCAALLAALMHRRGRRTGLSTGFVVGAIGAALCVLAGELGMFWLLLVGATLLGSASAAGLQARFAATDLATDAHRGRDLSLVMWSTTIGAVLGPNLVAPAGRMAVAMGLPKLTGAFVLAAIGLLGAATVIWLLMRPDPLLLSRAEPVRARVAGQVLPTTPPTRRQRRPPTAWEVVRHTPVVGQAVAVNALNQTVMVSVMIMTPLHMQHGHAGLSVIGLVISGHLLGMYAFSPLAGTLVDRLGAIGVLVLAIATHTCALLLCATAPVGSSWRLSLGLFLLGLGWSFGMIAASTLLTAVTAPELRTTVQGFTDLTTGLAAAVGGVVAGIVVATWSYSVLAAASLLVLAVMGACAIQARGLLRRHEKH